jgi:hypothetical protein
MNGITPINQVIPEKNIVFFSPHYDDFLFMLGGYVIEMKKAGLLATKHFHINLIFSQSNYQAGSGKENFNTKLDRIKLATGNRLLEDQECIDELLGAFNYRYELLREKECFLRDKAMADSEMEFPHGMYDDFNDFDKEIFKRMKERIGFWAKQKDTALIFPTAFKEHIDHFIIREAAIEVAKELGSSLNATFYFQEDKPYAGIATDVEKDRIERFVNGNKLNARTYQTDPEAIIDLAFKHYISQVEEVYKTGIRNRAEFLKELVKADFPCDRIYYFDPKSFAR